MNGDYLFSVNTATIKEKLINAGWIDLRKIFNYFQ